MTGTRIVVECATCGVRLGSVTKGDDMNAYVEQLGVVATPHQAAHPEQPNPRVNLRETTVRQIARPAL